MATKVREYKVVLSVIVDDENKPEYEAAMESLCKSIFNELKSICRNFDRGTGRLIVESERVK